MNSWIGEPARLATPKKPDTLPLKRLFIVKGADIRRLNNMKFIKLTNLIGKYLFMYEKQYGSGALIAYLEGFVKGLKRIKKHE